MNDQMAFDVALPHRSVTAETAAILDLMSGDPCHTVDRRRIVEAIVYCANRSAGTVDSNMVRARLSNADGKLDVFPRLMGAVYHQLRTAGVLVPDGWILNQDKAGRNAGRPAMRYRYIRRQVAA